MADKSSKDFSSILNNPSNFAEYTVKVESKDPNIYLNQPAKNEISKTNHDILIGSPLTHCVCLSDFPFFLLQDRSIKNPGAHRKGFGGEGDN